MLSRERALVVGYRGGVGRALSSLLANSTPGLRLSRDMDAILFVDREPSAVPAGPHLGSTIAPTAITSAEDIARLVRDYRITQVIDVSSLDTVDCTQVCDDLGADYLSTSVEEWPGRPPLATDQSIARLLPPQRPALSRRSHLIGSGANPGIVNALAFVAVEAFARTIGVDPTPDALDLYGIYITEQDTTMAADDPGTDVFGMTWSPEHCLEELFEPRAFAASHGEVVDLGHQPTERAYSARCGNQLIYGFAVPHEELVTLARRFPSVEIGFVYEIPLAARRALEAHPERNRPAQWPVRRLYPPWTHDLKGHDRLGVLLCSRRFGEFWMGFETSVEAGLTYGTNATQLQVAAGVLSGWLQLGRQRGIHFVEDLDARLFIETAAELLGSLAVVHDPAAPVRHLVERGLSHAAASYSNNSAAAIGIAKS